ncbi:hypothetical protein MKW94_023853 [Papaver nudicaule]|uniref:ABC transporter domain-containing protein n=1 Tax=Papaver nudicaule TaxID=74823 RepID=A0AA41VY43_PAPNU|nr:hypothetical protein [Papaver nudicaule]
MSITRGKFKLRVMEGGSIDSQIVVVLGENGTGKTTFLRLLAGSLRPDRVESSDAGMPEINVSYKAQIMQSVSTFTVRTLLHRRIPDSYTQPQFVSVVMEPLQIDKLMDKPVVKLSCGELQRVSLCLCLGKPADVYLIDEPSANLDSEQRLAASEGRRFVDCTATAPRSLLSGMRHFLSVISFSYSSHVYLVCFLPSFSNQDRKLEYISYLPF